MAVWMSENRVRLASIGVGFWGNALAEGVRKSQLGEIVSCFAPSDAHRQDFAARHGCRVARSFEAILSDPEVEGLLLATPNSLHAQQIEAAAAHGKHVFVEKPIALTVPDGLAATASCRRAGVVLAVGHQSRREPGVRKLKDLIESDGLGQIVAIEGNISTDTGMRQTVGRWRCSPGECPGGPLIQIGIHHIDTMCYLLGPIARAYGIQRHCLGHPELEDITMSLFEFENGVIGHLTSNYVSARIIDIRVIGTRGVAIYDKPLGLAVRRDTRESAVSEIIPLTASDPVVEEMAEFARSIRTGCRPEVGGLEATRALTVVLAAVESGSCGRPVSVPKLDAQLAHP